MSTEPLDTAPGVAETGDVLATTQLQVRALGLNGALMRVGVPDGTITDVPLGEVPVAEAAIGDAPAEPPLLFGWLEGTAEFEDLPPLPREPTKSGPG